MEQFVGSIRITLWRVLYVLAVAMALFFIIRQYGGWNLDEALSAYHQQIEQLKPGDEEQKILTLFKRVQSLNRPYTIGVVAVTGHTPVFGGPAYRVYDIGYYDMDRRVRHLMYVSCEQDRIRSLDPVTARDPHAPDFGLVPID